MTIYSPVSLLKQLNKVQYRNVKLKIYEMQKSDFKSFSLISKKYSWIPFAKVKMIKYDQNNLNVLQYKTSYFNDLYMNYPINNNRKTKSREEKISFGCIPTSKSLHKVTTEKKRDIMSMMIYMDQQDKSYYSAALQLNQ